METNRRRYQLHPLVHERWAGERLYFWRLAFYPTFKRDAIVNALASFLDKQQVLSYSLYELFGIHDLWLRIWLPGNITSGDFSRALYAELRSHNLQSYDDFVVRDILHHWVWQKNDDPTEMYQPTEDVLSRPLSDIDRRRLNTLWSNTPNDPAHDTDQLTAQLIQNKLLAPSSCHQGVKFFVVIPAPTHHVGADTATYLNDRLKHLLLSVSNIAEPSLYLGSGFGQARYLLMARLPNVFDISGRIAERINADAFQDLFNIRTFTFVSAVPDLVDHREGLPLSSERDEGGPTSASELLSQPESARFEVKASVFSDIGRFLLGDGELALSDKMTQAALKTIVAFLNTKGGTFVVGAIESGRFSEDVVTAKMPDATAVGDYLVVGVEPDLGAIDGDWDSWERRLRDVVDSRITPSASYRLRIVRLTAGTRTVAAISVDAAQDRWFYVRSDARGGTAQFFVRDGNRSIELSGPEQDAFKVVGARL